MNILHSLDTHQKAADDELRQRLAGKRVMLDVSVLLAGILQPQSYSARVLTTSERIIASEHVETLARRVLAWNASHLLADFNDGLLRLAISHKLERTRSGTKTLLPAWGRRLSPEDQQVLADALACNADYLITHDAAFFDEPVPGLTVSSPSSHLWYFRDPQNVRFNRDEWTYIGWFAPQWSSEVVKSSSELFYIFEIDDHARCFYSARAQAYKLEWDYARKARSLRISQQVRADYFHFVAVIAQEDHLTLFAEGESRAKRVRLGPVPHGVSLHPFMSAASQHQIFGSVRFRLADRALSVREVRRLYRARSLGLHDGELRFHEMVGAFSAAFLSGR